MMKSFILLSYNTLPSYNERKFVKITNFRSLYFKTTTQVNNLYKKRKYKAYKIVQYKKLDKKRNFKACELFNTGAYLRYVRI